VKQFAAVNAKESETARNFTDAFQFTRNLGPIAERIDVPTMGQPLHARKSAQALPYLYWLL
jgi:hypothetical protein